MDAARGGGLPIRAAAVAAVLASGMVLGGCTFGPEPGPSEPAVPTSTTPTQPPGRTATPPATTLPSPIKPPSIPARDLKAHLERYSQGLIDAGAPAVLLELRVGAEVWTHAAGVRNSAGEAARATDPVHVGDLTQPLVAVSVLKLAEEGMLSLDEPAGTDSSWV